MDLVEFKHYLDMLARDLPEITFSSFPTLSAEPEGLEERYLSYYGIDFHLQLPGVRHQIGNLDMAGYRIACQYWLPESAIGTVLVLHGYFDHMGLYGHLIRHLLEKNYAVVGFDLPGHGLSSGEQVAIDNFSRYVAVMEGVISHLHDMPQPLHAVGQSTGGAVLLKSLWSPHNPVNWLDKILLLAPLIRPVSWVKVKLMYLLLHKFKNSVEREFIDTCSNPDFLKFVAECDPLQSKHVAVNWVGAMKEWIELFPTLPRLERQVHLIQGDNDQTVAWRYNNHIIAEKISATALTMISGAGHHLVNESDALRQKVFDAMPF